MSLSLLDIMVAVIDYVEAFATIPIAAPNMEYSGARPYYRLTVMPASTVAFGISSTSRHRGIIQVDTVVDEAIGIKQAAEYVDAVIERFKRPRIIAGLVRITEPGYPGPPVTSMNEFFIPVTIPYTVLIGD